MKAAGFTIREDDRPPEERPEGVVTGGTDTPLAPTVADVVVDLNGVREEIETLRGEVTAMNTKLNSVTVAVAPLVNGVLDEMLPKD